MSQLSIGRLNRWASHVPRSRQSRPKCPGHSGQPSRGPRSVRRLSIFFLRRSPRAGLVSVRGRPDVRKWQRGETRSKIRACSTCTAEESHMQKTSPSAPLRVLTAHNVFDPSFNFDFLIEKAAHELTLSLAEGPNFFYWHAMNFSVSIHAIADHLWWVKAIDDPRWNK